MVCELRFYFLVHLLPNPKIMSTNEMPGQQSFYPTSCQVEAQTGNPFEVVLGRILVCTSENLHDLISAVVMLRIGEKND